LLTGCCVAVSRAPTSMRARSSKHASSNGSPTNRGESSDAGARVSFGELARAVTAARSRRLIEAERSARIISSAVWSSPRQRPQRHVALQRDAAWHVARPATNLVIAALPTARCRHRTRSVVRIPVSDGTLAAVLALVPDAFARSASRASKCTGKAYPFRALGWACTRPSVLGEHRSGRAQMTYGRPATRR
jgi:hypothetical protein